MAACGVLLRAMAPPYPPPSFALYPLPSALREMARRRLSRPFLHVDELRGPTTDQDQALSVGNIVEPSPMYRYNPCPWRFADG